MRALAEQEAAARLLKQEDDLRNKAEADAVAQMDADAVAAAVASRKQHELKEAAEAAKLEEAKMLAHMERDAQMQMQKAEHAEIEQQKLEAFEKHAIDVRWRKEVQEARAQRAAKETAQAAESQRIQA